jgi:uncharacterized protein YbjT (DUF2867 family)
VQVTQSGGADQAQGAPQSAIVVAGDADVVTVELIRHLLRVRPRPVRVAVPDVDGTRHAHLRALGPVGLALEYVRFDLHDGATHERVFRGASRLFLQQPLATAAAGDTMRATAGAAVRAGVRRIAHLSYSAAVGTVGRRTAAERSIAGATTPVSGASFTFLRASPLMQHVADLHEAEVRERGVLSAPAGRGGVTFVDGRDVAMAAMCVLTEDGHDDRTYRLTGREALTYERVATLLERTLRRPVTYTRARLVGHYRTLVARGHAPRAAFALCRLYAAIALGRASRPVGDLERLLGRPPISFAEYLREW